MESVGGRRSAGVWEEKSEPREECDRRSSAGVWQTQKRERSVIGGGVVRQKRVKSVGVRRSAAGEVIRITCC